MNTNTATNTAPQTMTIKGAEYTVLGYDTFDSMPLAKESFNRRGILAWATVRKTTGRVQKVAYVGMQGQFAGWVQL